jgi:SAM-dependent methyltransferase
MTGAWAQPYGTDPSQAADEIQSDARKIRQNPLLRAIYANVYRRLLHEVPPDRFPRLLELGSGGGFLKELAPHVTTSEFAAVPGIDRRVDATRLDEAFDSTSLDAICAFNVFHHLPDVAAFLHGATQVLRPGGRIALVEPWFTSIGQWFHRVIHHEPYLADPNDWRIIGEGRLAGANSRLPTSVFRDSDARLEKDFPHLRVLKREPIHKWLYLFSGGLKLNTRIPTALAERLVRLDERIRLGDRHLGIFALIVVERV